MTSSDGHEEDVPRDGVTAVASDRKAEVQAAKAEAKAAKAAKREAKTAARAATDAAKARAKAARREVRALEQAERDAARAEAKAEAKAVKAARATAKAEARAAKRAAKAERSAGRGVSPVVAHASALLEEAAELIRHGEVNAASSGQDVPAEDGPSSDEPTAATTDHADDITASRPAAEPAEGVSGASEAAATVVSDDAHAVDPIGVASAPPSSETVAPAPELTAGELPVALLAPEAGGLAISVPPGAVVAASIDIGSTSVHLLVGAVDGHHVTPLLDESVFLGLGDRVGAAGFFGEDVRDALVADLERYVTAARYLGAVSIAIVGTEPMRRAADAGTVVHEMATRTGAAVHVLDHVEEGLLTLIGATGGSPVSGELLLVDIGGGSTEFVVVGAGVAPRTVGLPLGAARLTRELVRSDPPALREIEALRKGVDAVMGGAPEASPSEIVAVGGTASNLLRLLPATAVDRSLTRRRIAVALAMLTVERSSEAASRHLIRPERARILPAGAIIVDAVLERYRADRLRVSDTGIREGAILAGIHGGPAWRDRLGALARGWHDRIAG